VAGSESFVRAAADATANQGETTFFSPATILPKRVSRMNDDVKSAPNDNPKKERETAELHLGQLAPGHAPAASSEDTVTAFVAKAAAETIKESSKPVVVPKTAGPVPPESMLGAVSYCYAKGVYGSNDIGRKLNQDPVFRASCQNEVPRPEDIRRFRRLNREAIQKTLEKALQFARAKVAEAWSPSNPFRGKSPAPATQVAGRLEETQDFARREASDRIDKATFIDGMSM
jgi:Transposase domain (DUF772)